MFDRMFIRSWLALGWIIFFITFWLILQILLPSTELMQNIINLEKYVINQNWDQASLQIDRLKQLWNSKRLLIQINNGTVEVSRFEELLEQIEVLINNKKSSAIDYIGGLKKISKSITNVFPGP